MQMEGLFGRPAPPVISRQWNKGGFLSRLPSEVNSTSGSACRKVKDIWFPGKHGDFGMRVSKLSMVLTGMGLNMTQLHMFSYWCPRLHQACHFKEIGTRRRHHEPTASRTDCL